MKSEAKAPSKDVSRASDDVNSFADCLKADGIGDRRSNNILKTTARAFN